MVSFHDLSSGTVSAWSWDFGDGEASQEREPTHVYSAVGEYTVRLEVSGPGGTSARSLEAAVRVHPAPAAPLEYGMNPSFQRWSGREIVFSDAMMRASEFIIVREANSTQEPAPLIPLGESPPRLGAGWPDLSRLAPGETAGAWLFGSMGGSLPDGRDEPYVLTWEGTGTCSLVGTAVLGEVLRRPRRAEVLVDPVVGRGNGTVALWIENSSRLDPIRNVHVWLPGSAETQPLFWPPYLERVQAMNGGRGPDVWRTLDWMRVNDHGDTQGPTPFVFDLAGTIRPDSPSQGTRRGMCPEFQVALCNAVGSDLHLCVPHRTQQMSEADYEHYLRDLFERVRDGAGGVPGINGGAPLAGLRDDLELYVELSNEIWNPLFPAGAWFQARARELGLTLHQVIAQELLRVWTVADEVFAGRRVVRRYVGGFIAEAGFVRRILEALPAGTRVDALGPSCYFRPRSDAIAGWMEGASPGACPNCPTPEEVVSAALLSLDELRPLLRAHRAVANAWSNPDGSHPRLELYEAGQSFDAPGAPWAAAARAAQRLPAMYDAYVQGLIPLLVEEQVDVIDWYSFMTDPEPSFGVAVGFGIWDSMDQELTLPVVEPYLDEGVPKAAAVYRGPPAR